MLNKSSHPNFLNHFPYIYLGKNLFTPRIAVVLHLYYEELSHEFLTYLRNIPEVFDLYITTPEGKGHIIHAEFEGFTNKLRFLNVKEVPNRGRDIAPFLILHRKNLKKYRFVLKIHSKMSLHVSNLSEWRKYLLDKLLGSETTVGSILLSLEQNLKLGLVFPENYFVAQGFIDISPWGDNFSICAMIAKKAGFEITENKKFEFPSGSMFWFRPLALKSFFDLDFSWDDFDEKDKVDGTLAHAFERLFLFFADNQGYTTEKVPLIIPQHPGIKLPAKYSASFLSSNWCIISKFVIRLMKSVYNVTLNLSFALWRYTMNNISAITIIKVPPSPEFSPPKPEPFLYHLDEFEDTGFICSIQGWAFHETSEITSAKLIVEHEKSKFEYPVITGIARHDVYSIFPFKNAINSGLSCNFYPEFQGEFSVFIKVNYDDGESETREITDTKLHFSGLDQINREITFNRSQHINKPGTSPQKINVYTSSCGNYFFTEIAELLLQGIRSAGYIANHFDEKNDFSEDADWHIIIAPHEFFLLRKENIQTVSEIPKNLILFNTEQPSSPWFKITSKYLKYAYEIWDMEYSSASKLKEKLQYAFYFPIGFHPYFKPYNEAVILKNHAGTIILPDSVKHRNYKNSRFKERPIDIFFIGFASMRRQAFFARYAAVFAKYYCYFHFSNEKTPVIPGENTFMDTETVTGLLQRSRIVLNVHSGSDNYFEWHRIVLQGIWQKSLVISEYCGIAPPFTAGIDYIQADSDTLAEKCEYYLTSEAGQEEAQQIIDNASFTLHKKCQISETVKSLLENLDHSLNKQQNNCE